MRAFFAVCRPLLFSIAAMLAPALANADAPASNASGADPAVLAQIRDAAMNSDWAYQRLADLADKIGPRLSGSPGAEAAVAQVAAAMSSIGTRVMLQPAKVPHWVRGIETGEIVRYPGQPAGITQKLVLTALGGSIATPAKGLTAQALVVHSFDQLKAHAVEAKGSIVVFDIPYDQNLADNGQAGPAYGEAGEQRFRGPAAAAKLGAAAVLVRSVGGANYRLPHTGVTQWDDGGTKLPCAALSAEDAMLIDRLAAQGAVTLHLTLTPQILPDVESHNVIADLVGREKPDEVVIVSGHLDSWDLGTGAMDDGLGVTAAMGVAQVLQSLNLHPRRSVRVIAWMNEENGSRGSKAYFESVKDSLGTQAAAIESDFGVGRPLGITASATPESMAMLAPAAEVLRAIGAGVLERRDGEVGADVNPLQQHGVPGFAPLIDSRHYFDYHHTAADTLDKVEPDVMRRTVAVLAVLAYTLAEAPDDLPRVPVTAEK
jgi:hypothetical protein